MPAAWFRPYNPQPVKAILADRGLSQHEICERYDLERTNLNKVVNGRMTVSQQFAEALTDATGLPIGVLFEPELYLTTHWYRRALRQEQYASGGESNG